MERSDDGETAVVAGQAQEVEVQVIEKGKKKKHKKPHHDGQTGHQEGEGGVAAVPGAHEVEVPIKEEKKKKKKKTKKMKEKEKEEKQEEMCDDEEQEKRATSDETEENGDVKENDGDDMERPKVVAPQVEETVRSLHNSAQAVGLAIKKAVQFTVAAATMIKDHDPLEEEHFTDTLVYHTSCKALSATMVITDHSPLVFHRIRSLAGITPRDYLEEWMLTPLNEQKLFKKAASGKSGSLFLFSANGRFIIKTLPLKEGRTLIKMLPAYYKHLIDNPHSLLCRLLGYYGIEVGGHTHYLVMQRNIFYNAPAFSEIYDLKGSTRGRKSTEEERKRGGNKCVLKDLDFIEAKRRIALPEHVKEKFLHAVKEDSEFLVPNNLIDYSLLVGIHKKAGNEKKAKKKKNKKEHLQRADEQEEVFLWKGGVDSADGSEVYYMGIIDFLSPYATKKKMAHLLKRGLLFEEPAALSSVKADYYSSRFINLLITNILA